MTKKSFLLMLLMPDNSMSIGLWSQIVAWQFNGKTGGEVTVNATTNNGNLATSVISRGAGLTIPGSPASITYSVPVIAVNGTQVDAITNNKYLQFAISANPGIKFH